MPVHIILSVDAYIHAHIHTPCSMANGMTNVRRVVHVRTQNKIRLHGKRLARALVFFYIIKYNNNCFVQK